MPTNLTPVVNTRSLNAQLRKIVVASHACRCAFPDCNQILSIDNTFIGEIASIVALHESSPRFNKEADRSKLLSPDNYLLLCPNHHSIIDRQSNIYTIEWLKMARDNHLKQIRTTLSAEQICADIKIPIDEEIPLSRAVSIWQSASRNDSEEFWHQLFEKSPVVISQLFPRTMIQFGSKCYVGGKTLHNTNGNIADFVYANKSTNNVVLVEIKTPLTSLIGKQYRNNSFSMSEELSGSIVQVLSYRDSLVKDYYNLCKIENGTPFHVFSPKCVVIAGNTQDELTTPTKRKSFELFRGELSGVEIVGFDELFDKIQCILDIMK